MIHNKATEKIIMLKNFFMANLHHSGLNAVIILRRSRFMQ
jgi:hypothetical protein